MASVDVFSTMNQTHERAGARGPTFHRVFKMDTTYTPTSHALRVSGNCDLCIDKIIDYYDYLQELPSISRKNNKKQRSNAWVLKCIEPLLKGKSVVTAPSTRKAVLKYFPTTVGVNLTIYICSNNNASPVTPPPPRSTPAFLPPLANVP